MASRRLLLRAARLLAEEAELTKESCQIGRHDWACADCADKAICLSRKKHEELQRTAKALRDAA